MMDLKSWLVALTFLLVPAVGLGEITDDPALQTPDGPSILFSTWCAENGPAALLIWASWSPEGEQALAGAAALQAIASKRNLSFVLVSVQEPIANARKVLGPTDLPWLFDRHGALLKKLLVYRVPSIVIVSEEGRVLSTGPAEPQTLLNWKAP